MKTTVMKTTTLGLIKYPLFLLFFSVFLVSCQKDQIDISDSNNTDVNTISQKIPHTWNQLYLQVERYTPGYKPPVSARNIGYINMIAYESIVHAPENNYSSLTGNYEGLQIDHPESNSEYNWEVVLNSAYEKAFEMFFPTSPAEQQFKILEVASDLRNQLQYETDFEVYQRSSSYGEYVAETIYLWTMEDHWGHEAYNHNTDPNYVPPIQTGYWKPTYPDFQPALLPNWGNVRTFAALASDEVAPPPAFSTDPNSKIYKEALETQTLVNEIKEGLHKEDQWIAEFWSDDCPILTFSPAGRWISITNQVIRQERLGMIESVAAYAKVSMALADAGIKCWQQKYKFNMLRPIDFIRDYMGDPEWNTIMCPDGSGGFYTPNFPTYPSGHATFAGAASVILTDLFGGNYRFTDRSHEGRTEFNGAPRTFDSFHEMALENAYSRVPLGVHFAADSEAGTDLGLKVGDRVKNLPWK